MKKNDKKLKDLGFEFETMNDLIEYLKSNAEWLESHNKNYTNEQYYRISDIKDILKCLEQES